MTDQKPQKQPAPKAAPVPPSAAWVEEETKLREALKLLAPKAVDRLVASARRGWLAKRGGTLAVDVLSTTAGNVVGIVLPPEIVEELGNPKSIPYRIVQGKHGRRIELVQP